ncbi:MAG: TonB-dependent receptor [Pseudomonadales bacterium]|nr:TonB-dependent receptor [Pseudomonadales bacterium]
MDATGMSAEQWLASGLSDPRVERSEFDNTILVVNTSESNATKMKFSSVDLSLIYNFEIGSLGDFNAKLDASYLEDYSYQLLPISPEVQGVGRQNAGTGAVQPLPRWKSNLGLNWNQGIHAASVQVHYTHDVRYDSPLAGLAPFYGKSQYVPTWLKESAQVDAQYRIDLSDILGSLPQNETQLILGVADLFNEMAPAIYDFPGYDNRLYNAIGRRFYARLSVEL